MIITSGFNSNSSSHSNSYVVSKVVFCFNCPVKGHVHIINTLMTVHW